MRVSIIFFFLRLMLGVEARADDPLLMSSRFAAIEQQIGGRLGVAALDTGNGRRIEYRAAERFPMCSTFKFLLAAAILQQGDRVPLDRRLSYGADDLLEWAPITRKHLSEGGMPVRNLCAAAMEYRVSAVAPKPVNVLLIGPNMRVVDLAAAGVRRVSVGGALAAAAWSGFDQAVQLLAAEGRLPRRP